MRDPISKRTAALKPSGIRKFFDIVATMKDAISLGVGEPDFDTPWFIREEGIYALEKGRTFYTANAGLMELRVAIKEYMNRRFNLNYDASSEVVVTVGGSEAIDMTMRAMLNPGDEVIIPQPCFVSYEPCAIMADGIPVTIDLQNEDKFKLKPEDLEAAITPKTKLLVMPFPNNPTGSVMTREELEPIAKICIEHDIYVLSDEIYTELTYNGQEPASIAQCDGMRDRTIVINGFSKAYAMTGWRLGYACGPATIIKQVTKLHQYAIMCAPTTSQYAAVAAIRNGDNDISKMRDSYNQRRRFVLKRLSDMGILCFEPEGAFYVFPDIRPFGMSSEEFCERLLQEEKVAVVPGDAFGKSGEGFVRISYAYSMKQLEEALGRIEKYIKKIKNQDKL